MCISTYTCNADIVIITCNTDIVIIKFIENDERKSISDLCAGECLYLWIWTSPAHELIRKGIPDYIILKPLSSQLVNCKVAQESLNPAVMGLCLPLKYVKCSSWALLEDLTELCFVQPHLSRVSQSAGHELSKSAQRRYIFPAWKSVKAGIYLSARHKRGWEFPSPASLLRSKRNDFCVSYSICSREQLFSPESSPVDSIPNLIVILAKPFWRGGSWRTHSHMEWNSCFRPAHTTRFA